MITTKQEKNKTTIIIPRRLKKRELDQLLNYLSLPEIKPKKTVTKKQIKEMADKVTNAAWEKLKKKRGFTWS
ncbi:MAG: hypothetical protein ABUT20_27575 [Bacteroidota bacterium]